MRDLTREDAPRKPVEGENVIIIDGIPVVGPDKVPKLQGVIKKVMTAFGEVMHTEIPLETRADGKEKTLGFCFVEFKTKDQALEAISLGNGYKLDKKHVFKINSMADFEKFLSTSTEWQPPSDEEFEEKENLQSWLLNPHCEDQLVVRHDWSCEVFWSRKRDKALVESRFKWSDAENHAPVAWSPKGTYLATFHELGVCLWGGKKWTRIARFPHTKVKLIEISPCEKYIVTWSTDTPSNKQDPQQIIIWDIKTGEKKRGFEAEEDPSWPIFKWSHDDKYFARMKEGESISIYQTPSMDLLDKKSLKVRDVKAFSWCPSDNIIVYWTPESSGERPARLTLMQIPERKELTTKNLYQVKDCKLIWQKNGDHLCVCVERFTKSKKQTYTQFMLFHMRKKLIPCDLLDVKDKIEHFAWEPIGYKFAIIHGEPNRMAATVYDLSNDKLVEHKNYERVEANVLFWSPRGRHLVIAGMGSVQGMFQFVDTDDLESKEMGSGQHINASTCEWDPTGRYVVTSVSAWQNIQHDLGYMVWSFQGKPLQRHNIPQFYQVLWRPRPPTLLTKAQIKDAERNFKDNQNRFEAEDKMQQDRASEEVLQARRQKMEEWKKFEDKANETLQLWKRKMASLRPPVSEEDMHEEEVEEIVPVFVREDVEVLGR